MSDKDKILLYTTNDDAVKVEVLYKEESIWLTQKMLAKLFGVRVPAINKHLKNIFESGELLEDSVISILETTHIKKPLHSHLDRLGWDIIALMQDLLTGKKRVTTILTDKEKITP